MIFEVIIIISAVIIFILVARRLPDLKKENTVKFNLFEKTKQKTSDFWNDEKINYKNKTNFEIGNSYFDKGNYKEAEKYYVKAAAEDPQNPKIYNRLGIIYLEQKNYRDAKDAFLEVLKFDDKKASRHINYGLACLNLRNYKEAIDSFEKAVKLEPKNQKYKAILKEAKAKQKLFEKK